MARTVASTRLQSLLRIHESQQLTTEVVLLLLTAGFLFVNFLSLALSRTSDITHWNHLLFWLICAFGGRAILDRYVPNRNKILFPVAMFLSGWGILIIDRLFPVFADRQTLWLVVSIGAMLGVAILPHLLRWLRTYRYILLLVGLTLIVSTIFLGRNPSGQAEAPQLWLGFGSIFFQPSEILKIILVAFLASYLGEQYPIIRAQGLEGGTQYWFSPRLLGPIVLMWGLSILFLIWQRDLGTAILFFTVFIVLLYVVTGNLLIPVGGTLLILIAGYVGYNQFPVVQLRVDIWLNPWLEPDGDAFQIVQSLMAFSAGGIFGQGIDQGFPTFIPVVHSDFVFAALAEEWGFIGVTTAIVMIATFVMQSFRIAIMLQGRVFNALLAIGLGSLIAVQSILILGGVLKLIPLTGVTLPFISYGGSSMLMVFIVTGLLLRLSAGEQ